MTSKIAVSIGDQVYAGEATEAFGAVRHIAPHDLVVDVEGLGDVTLPADAVLRVHDGKVIVDVAKLPSDIRRAIAHAHVRETE